MNLSISDFKGELLVVSQFTLAADLSQGRRPSFLKAKEPKEAEKLYDLFTEKLKEFMNENNYKPGEYGLLSSLGPGFSSELVLFMTL